MLSIDGPAYDLVTVMSKFLHFGMSLYEVVRAVTSRAATAIGWNDVVGSLGKGKVADITILRLEKGTFMLEDCEDNCRTCNQLLQPVAVWKGAVAFPIKTGIIKASMKK